MKKSGLSLYYGIFLMLNFWSELKDRYVIKNTMIVKFVMDKLTGVKLKYIIK